jgi:hypothetical protein
LKCNFVMDSRWLLSLFQTVIVMILTHGNSYCICDNEWRGIRYCAKLISITELRNIGDVIYSIFNFTIIHFLNYFLTPPPPQPIYTLNTYLCRFKIGWYIHHANLKYTGIFLYMLYYEFSQMRNWVALFDNSWMT